MTCAVDRYTATFMADTSILDTTVPNWNTVQAILRKTSRAVGSCVFVLQGTLAFTLLLTGVDSTFNRDTGLTCFFLLIPSLLIVLGLSRVFFSASIVTDMCQRIPSLINSCEFDESH